MARSTASKRRRRNAEESNAETVKTAKLSASVSVDQYRRLVVHALYLGKTQGELVGDLIDTYLRDYRVQTNNTSPRSDSSRPAEITDRLELAGEAIESAALAAA